MDSEKSKCNNIFNQYPLALYSSTIAFHKSFKKINFMSCILCYQGQNNIWQHNQDISIEDLITFISMIVEK